MIDAATVLVVIVTFLFAGTVKGVIGLGLPTISLALLTVALGLPEAMNLLLVPSAATNLWQAVVGGNGKALLRRLWPFLATAAATVWIGAQALTRADLSHLSALLGVLIVVYATVSLTGFRLTLSDRQAARAGPWAGSVNGILTGMTGSFVFPGVLYLQAIGLSRDELVQAMGMLFTVSTLALAAAHGGTGLLAADLCLLSTAALLPAIIGMALGQRIRKGLSEDVFRRVFFFSLLVLGLYIVTNALR